VRIDIASPQNASTRFAKHHCLARFEAFQRFDDLPRKRPEMAAFDTRFVVRFEV
jgi:hypothetical protein